MFLGLRLGAHFPTARIPYTDELPLEGESDADDSETDDALLPSAVRQARARTSLLPVTVGRWTLLIPAGGAGGALGTAEGLGMRRRAWSRRWSLRRRCAARQSPARACLLQTPPRQISRPGRIATTS